MKFDWKGIVKTVAPFLGGALGGPAGAAAATMISRSLLGKDDGTELEIEQAILNATPEQLAALKKMDYDYKIKMSEIGLSEKELHIKDRQSARKLFEINIWPQMILSAFYTIGYFSVLILIMNGDIAITSEMQATFNIILGVLTGAIPMILQFWFGSSTGSKEKTARIK